MRSKSPLNTPLSRARGLGSAHSGFHHWWIERVTAVALIPLSLWLVCSIMHLVRGTYADASVWLSSPMHAIFFVLFLITGAWHAALGLRVVYEDYLHCACVKTAAIVGTNLLFGLAAVAGVLAVIKIHLG